MAHYAIGDIQGCFDELTALLGKIGFNHGTDTLWLTGDIVNRGPKSLETLQFCIRHETACKSSSATTTCTCSPSAAAKARSNAATQSNPYSNTPTAENARLAARATALIREGGRVMIHAGILPQWRIAKAESLAGEAEAELRGKNTSILLQMYGNKPAAWDEGLEGYARLRFIVNAFTRMRALTFKTNWIRLQIHSEKMPPYLRPWFKAPDRQTSTTPSSSDTGPRWATRMPTTSSRWTPARCGRAADRRQPRNGRITQVQAAGGIDWKSFAK
ncbi:diadenosine tetraphosphatase [Neisseria gonorrhoeae]|uniref:Diadenosine tetraphosphatase n=1 Tax=Neisseria gonorrhoeae TaxID=485 RepID=A0A378W246_NEIGO|nr:diadenosine tetraphosphatase [Neisseria gonorrhoeae]